MHGVGASGAVLLVEPLQLALDGFDGGGIEQFAKLGVAEQFPQLRLIDDERLGAPLGERRIAVVQEACDVAEKQRRREWRRPFRVDGDDPYRPAAEIRQGRDQRGHVEEVAQTLAIGLEQDRERPVSRGNRQQIGGALALLPQRGAHPWTPLGKQQRPRGVLAEFRGEQGGCPQLTYDQRLHLVGVGQQQPGIGRPIHVRKPHDEPVIPPQRFDIDAGALADARRGCHRPRRVNAAATRGQDAHPPVPELVADALDEDGRLIRKRPRDSHLITQVLEQVLGGAFIEIVVAREPIAGGRRGQAQQFAHQPADGDPELERTPGAVTFPERHLPGSPGAGETRTRSCVISSIRHDEAPSTKVSPGRLSNTISSSNSPTRAAPGPAPRRKTPNRPRSGMVPPLAIATRLAPSRATRVPRAAVPGDARPQLGELVGWIPARQHVQHTFEDRAAQFGEGCRAAQHREQLLDIPSLHGRHGDDLLRHDIEGIAGIPRRFDGSLVHRLRDRGARDEVAAKLREDDALAHGVDLVAAAADALEPAGDRGRRLDLDHEINRAHVNAQLERRGGDQRSQIAGLQQVLDLDALRARDGAMMGPHQRFARQLVQRARETFGEPAAVDEDQRGPVRANQLQQPRDGSPTRSRGARRRPTPDRSGHRRQLSAWPCPRPGPRS